MEIAQLIWNAHFSSVGLNNPRELPQCGLKPNGSLRDIREVDNGTIVLEARNVETNEVFFWVIAPKTFRVVSETEKAEQQLRTKLSSRSILGFIVSQRRRDQAVEITLVGLSIPQCPVLKNWDCGRYAVEYRGLPHGRSSIGSSAASTPVAASAPGAGRSAPRPISNSPPQMPPLPPHTSSSGGGAGSFHNVAATFSGSAGRNSFHSGTPPFHPSSLQSSSIGNTQSPQMQPVSTAAQPPITGDDFALPPSVSERVPTLAPITMAESPPISPDMDQQVPRPFADVSSDSDDGGDPQEPLYVEAHELARMIRNVQLEVDHVRQDIDDVVNPRAP